MSSIHKQFLQLHIKKANNLNEKWAKELKRHFFKEELHMVNKHIKIRCSTLLCTLVAQMVKNPPAMQKSWVWSLGWEDPLEKGMATHSSILAWKRTWIEEPRGLQSRGSQTFEHEWTTNTCAHTHTHTHTLHCQPLIQFSSVSSYIQSCLTLCDPVNRSTPGLPVHYSYLRLLKPMSIESVMPSNHLILCRPLLLLPSVFPSIRVFSNESALCIRWPKYWNFSINMSPSNEHPGLISFRMDWVDLLAVQGTLKSLLQHHSSKESILQCSAFFIDQLSHPYTTTGKTIGFD